MSNDKHKKRDRAYAFLRSLHWGRAWGGGHKPHMPYEKNGKTEFSGPMTPIMRYCVERGLAVVTRRARSHGEIRNRRNRLDAWMGRPWRAGD